MRAGGSEQELRVDQSAGDGWLPIGEFTFAEGTDQWIQVEDNTGEDSSLRRKISADAIRLVRLDPPEPEPEPDAGGGGGGEDAGGNGGGEVDAGNGGGGAADAGPRDPGSSTTTTSSCVCSSTPAPRTPSGSLIALAFACLAGVLTRRRR